LNKLRTHELYAKFSKCKFWLQEIVFLGHIIIVEGVKVDPEKVKAVSKWKQPTNVTKVHNFFGLAGYTTNDLLKDF
jgi:hypothetical protein